MSGAKQKLEGKYSEISRDDAISRISGTYSYNTSVYVKFLGDNEYYLVTQITHISSFLAAEKYFAFTPFLSMEYITSVSTTDGSIRTMHLDKVWWGKSVEISIKESEFPGP
jgi:hypothetical protein